MKQQEPARILTINQVAEILQCSKAHVSNALNGKVATCPRYRTSRSVAEN